MSQERKAETGMNGWCEKSVECKRNVCGVRKDDGA